MAEREKELTKLIQVMRRLARGAHFVALGDETPDAGDFCVAQYNRTLMRLTVLEPKISAAFPPLVPATAPEAVSLTAKAIIAYFDAAQSARSQTVDFSLLDIILKTNGLCCSRRLWRGSP